MQKKSVRCSFCESLITDLSDCHTIIDDKVGNIMLGKESPTIYLLCPRCYAVFIAELYNMKLEVKNG